MTTFVTKRGFTLIEILIVVTILGTLSALTVPQFAGAASDSALIGTLRQAQTIRIQIEVFRTRENFDPDLNGSQWVDLIDNDYLHTPPRNTLNGSYMVGPAPAAGIGWVWRDKGIGTYVLFPTDATFLAELVV